MLDFIIFIGRINYKYYTAQGKPFEIISDIGSGINYKKKGLKELIDDGGEEDDKNNSSHADPK